ncbi:MAG TPA: hypothetical protein PKD00_09595 [Burkholderiales bacterium]|nr:hypothetical protein [Burkholderiales bacterium]
MIPLRDNLKTEKFLKNFMTNPLSDDDNFNGKLFNQIELMSSIWTVMEEDGEFFAVPGYHVANVFGYLIQQKVSKNNKSFHNKVDTETKVYTHLTQDVLNEFEVNPFSRSLENEEKYQSKLFTLSELHHFELVKNRQEVLTLVQEDGDQFVIEGKHSENALGYFVRNK